MSTVYENPFLFTREDFHKMYEERNGFNDEFNTNNCVRPEGQPFSEFIDEGSKALFSNYPDLVKTLKYNS